MTPPSASTGRSDSTRRIPRQAGPGPGMSRRALPITRRTQTTAGISSSSSLEPVARVAASRCETVRIDISENPLEYPFQALLRERSPYVRFTHTDRACAVLCLDCAGKRGNIGGFAPPITIGHFLLYFPAA